jgi:UDPglucose 6-dehydrogenase
VRVCVQGLWHLGSVTAACLAALGHEVAGYDDDVERVTALQAGSPPILEPGLPDLLQQGLAAGRLRFDARAQDAASHVDVLWVAYDTPVDEDDQADTAFVKSRVEAMLPHLPRGCVVVVSSQLPVGSIAALERFAVANLPQLDLTFACSPENLRLGKAIDVFRNPDRIVVGTRDDRDRTRVAPLFESISPRIEWMSVESAEMTKHAVNAFLALSVTFANELATLCEAVGADAKEVERGLKSEMRIGPRAYLAPGAAFAGGTLARDIAFLVDIAATCTVAVPVLESVRPSNEVHKGWIDRKLAELVDVSESRIAVWGLTYKAGTNTLRRSAAIELCRRLGRAGARLVVHDPVVATLPEDLSKQAAHAKTPLEAVIGADALVICTEWPEYRRIPAHELAVAAPGIVVVDPNRFLGDLAMEPRIRYFAVGTPRIRDAA